MTNKMHQNCLYTRCAHHQFLGVTTSSPLFRLSQTNN